MAVSGIGGTIHISPPIVSPLPGRSGVPPAPEDNPGPVPAPAEKSGVAPAQTYRSTGAPLQTERPVRAAVPTRESGVAPSPVEGSEGAGAGPVPIQDPDTVARQIQQIQKENANNTEVIGLFLNRFF